MTICKAGRADYRRARHVGVDYFLNSQEENRNGDAAMDRRSIVLAALHPAAGGTHTPVQVQKLFFLIDRVIPELVGGPHFKFVPYDYGPFDSDVYSVLEHLQCDGLVEIVEAPDSRSRRYRLTDIGQSEGEAAFAMLPPKAQDFVRRASTFVRSLRFADLVAAIYKAFPDMKANSVFRG